MSITRNRVGIRQVGMISKECRGFFDRRTCERRRSMLRLSQARPRQSEERDGGGDPGKEQNHSDRETKRPDQECKRKEQQQQHQRQMRQRRSHQPRGLKGERREREEPRCTGCADVTKGISAKHAHNAECRNRIAKLLMDEGAQRVESYFDRTRVREETSDRRRVWQEYPCRRCMSEDLAVQGGSGATRGAAGQEELH